MIKLLSVLSELMSFCRGSFAELMPFCMGYYQNICLLAWVWVSLAYSSAFWHGLGQPRPACGGWGPWSAAGRSSCRRRPASDGCHGRLLAVCSPPLQARSKSCRGGSSSIAHRPSWQQAAGTVRERPAVGGGRGRQPAAASVGGGRRVTGSGPLPSPA